MLWRVMTVHEPELEDGRKYAFPRLAGGFGPSVAFALLTFIRLAARSLRP